MFAEPPQDEEQQTALIDALQEWKSKKFQEIVGEPMLVKIADLQDCCPSAFWLEPVADCQAAKCHLLLQQRFQCCLSSVACHWT